MLLNNKLRDGNTFGDLNGDYHNNHKEINGLCKMIYDEVCDVEMVKSINPRGHCIRFHIARENSFKKDSRVTSVGVGIMVDDVMTPEELDILFNIIKTETFPEYDTEVSMEKYHLNDLENVKKLTVRLKYKGEVNE